MGFTKNIYLKFYKEILIKNNNVKNHYKFLKSYIINKKHVLYIVKPEKFENVL